MRGRALRPRRAASLALVALALLAAAMTAARAAEPRARARAPSSTASGTCPIRTGSASKLIDKALDIVSAQPDAAVSCLHAALKADPRSASAHMYLSSIAAQRGAGADAESWLRKGLAVCATESERRAILVMLGETLASAGRTAECAAELAPAFEAEPTSTASQLAVLARCLLDSGAPDRALAVVSRAPARADFAALGLAQRAMVLTLCATAALRTQRGEHEAYGLAQSRAATELLPDSSMVWFNLGTALTDAMAHRRWRSLADPRVAQLDVVDEAISAFRRALAIKPDDAHSRVSIFHMANYNAVWDTREADHRFVRSLLAREMREGKPPTITAEMALLAFDEPFLHSINKALVATLRGSVDRELVAQLSQRAADRRLSAPPQQRRVRVGFLATFVPESVMADVLFCAVGKLDRSRFHVSLLDLAGGSDYARGLGADALVPLNEPAGEAAARAIARGDIDVLIDCSAHKHAGGLLAVLHKPAPVIASYLGWPSSVGAAEVDYFLTDAIAVPRTLAPSARAERFTERVVWLPSMFCGCHRSRYAELLPGLSVAARAATLATRRAALGLPSNASFVFFSPNQMYKLTPETLDVWARVLVRTPAAVLWMLRHPMPGEARVRRELAARGVRPEQVFFSDTLAKSDFVLAAAVADVMLDTWAYTGGATTLDVLFAGVPMVTMPGDRVVARMSASIVTALGLGAEMVALDEADYEERAVRLATDPGAVAALRDALARARNREDSTLWSPERWARSIGTFVTQAWERHLAGQPPAELELSS